MSNGNLTEPTRTEICKDIFIDSKIRLGAIMYMEDKYDCRIEEMDWENPRISMVVNFITAMAIQTNKNLTADQIRDRVENIPIDEIQSLTDKVSEAFRVYLKNPKAPEEGGNPEPVELTT